MKQNWGKKFYDIFEKMKSYFIAWQSEAWLHVIEINSLWGTKWTKYNVPKIVNDNSLWELYHNLKWIKLMGTTSWKKLVWLGNVCLADGSRLGEQGRIWSGRQGKKRSKTVSQWEDKQGINKKHKKGKAAETKGQGKAKAKVRTVTAFPSHHINTAVTVF